MMILTITIPTYNGEVTIRSTLDSVVCQLEEGVEIVVSDNASTDRTGEIVHEYLLKYSNLHYFRNDENLGFDRNVDLVVQRSKGEYVWLLGDDDEIVFGGIKKVLMVLQNNNNLAAIYVNFSCYIRETGKCITERRIEIYDDIFCDNSDQFLSTVMTCSAFLSSNVVCRSLWLQADNMCYIGTNWIQYGTLLSILPGHSAYCIAAPYVMNKGFNPGEKVGNKGGVALKIILNLFDIIQELPRGSYSEKSIQKVLKAVYGLLPRKISSSRRNGLSLSWSLLSRLIKKFGLYPLFWFIDIPLLFLPRFVHCFIYKIYKNSFIRYFSRKMSSLQLKRITMHERRK